MPIDVRSCCAIREHVLVCRNKITGGRNSMTTMAAAGTVRSMAEAMLTARRSRLNGPLDDVGGWSSVTMMVSRVTVVVPERSALRHARDKLFDVLHRLTPIGQDEAGEQQQGDRRQLD